MTHSIQTIPDMLVLTRENQTEAARRLNVNRSTIMKYARDRDATCHAIINGCLMVKTGKKPRGNDG